MSGFTDSIVGGVGSLIRKYIKSPNYAPNVSGWSINQDGSAEFNNATFRGTVIIDSTTSALLVYDGTPTLGNLILAISSVAGIDSFGNNYNEGLTFYPVQSGPPEIFSGISWLGFPTINQPYIQGDPIGGTAPVSMSINGPSNENDTPQLILGEGETVGSQALLTAELVQLNSPVLNNLMGYQIGNGAPGGYYSEYVGLPGLTLASAVERAMSGLISAELNSDYGSAFNLVSGIWTCPVSSYYDFTFYTEYNAGISGRIASFIKTTGGSIIIAQDVDGVSSAYQTCSGTRYITAGTQIEFTAIQSSGSNKNLAGTPYIFVGRRL